MLVLLAASGFSPVALAAVGSCAPATGQGANGPADYVGYCWIDFTGYNDTLARSSNGQDFTINLDGGGTLSFKLRATASPAGSAFVAATSPSWSGAPLGAAAFTGIPGAPVLYQSRDGTTTTVTLSGISVVVGGGQVPYAFVAADAESSNGGETLGFTTNGSPWTLLATMRNGSSTLYPALSGVGTTTVTETGVAGTVGAYAFASEGNPTTISASMLGSGLQGIAFAVKYRATDMSIAKTHGGSFALGGTGAYTLTVRNNGPDVNLAANTIVVTDTLPAGLTYASASGTGWSCGSVGQVVTCTRGGAAAGGTTLPPITLNVNVSGSAPASVTNTATVAVPSGYDPDTSNNTASDVTAILRPNLSTSTKGVVDLNGGDANPGDTLRYTITLVESAGVAAGNVTFTDSRPANTTFGGVLNAATTCPGTDTSTATLARKTGITLAAGGSCTVVFDVTVDSVAPGTTIDNTATITPASGTGATPASSTIVVSQSQLASSGNKILYVYDNGQLTRTPQTSAGTSGATIASGGSRTWTLAPAVATGKSLVLTGGQVVVNLRMRCTGDFLCTWGNQATSVELRRGSTVLATSSAQNVQNENFALRTFTINLGADQTISAGETLSIRVVNAGGGWVPQTIAVAQYSGGASTVAFATSTVVNVDGITFHSAAYPSTATKAQYVQGETIWVRAVVSDPFGAYDVSAARLRLVDAAGTVLVNDTPMTERAPAQTAATKTFEGSYTIQANPRIGSWTARVTGIEGTEVDGGGNPTVTHSRNGSLPVHGRITLGKTWSGATAGNAVSLAIAGGSSASAGSSTAPSTTSVAVASAAASATLTLSETFTSGVAGNYSPALTCTRVKDSVSVPLTGTGLSRTIAMPNDSAVACVWTNTWTIPLTVMKASKVLSDPVNGTTNPKAIPGAIIEYQITVLNPIATPVDADTVFVIDALPPEVEFRVADIGGPGPVTFTGGPPPSGLAYNFASLASTTDDIAFSANGGGSWSYSPSGSDTDAAVNAIRINPKGMFNGNTQFTVRFQVRLK
ncbi:MAG: CshA/CshB family fibrillar adhesin-related protein [Pseudomonadota bacterium]|nr:CshA/CshB family fibrillar adhesin-related protein [Pseudomonadota bacterium]